MAMLHVYGCSFSYGSWINFPYITQSAPFFQTQFTGYTWSAQVAKYLNLELNQRSLGGGSNQTTLSRVIKDSNNFSKGDKVVIGITKPGRLSLEPYRINDIAHEHKYGSKKTDYGTPWGGKIAEYTDINAGLVSEFFRRAEEQDGIKLFRESFLKTNAMKKFSDEAVFSIMEMFMHWHQSEFSTKVYDDYDKGLFSSLMGLLHRSGVDVYVWSYDLWDEFENITEWLQNRKNIHQRMKDNHWSPNGHTLFAAFAIEQIKKDLSFWDLSLLSSYRQKRNYSYIADLKVYVSKDFECDYTWYDEKLYPWVKNREDIYKYATNGPT